MLDICLLGTGGMMPLPYRWLTAMMARHNGSNLLIDCGEGTQITMKLQGWSFKAIDIICFTHYHADHISGLPGLLLTIGNSNREEPLTLIGPKGLKKVVSGLRSIAPELPFPLEFIELSEKQERISIKGYQLEAFRVDHKIACYGYTIQIDRQGKFDVERAKAQGIPMPFWSRLQKGETIEADGTVYTTEMVLGPPRKGIKVGYCTDTRPIPAIADHVQGADLFICEGMYGEPLEETNAKEYKHMTFQEAASLAKKAEVGELWLTHFSPSLVYPKEFLDVARKVFPRTVIGKDRMTKSFHFEED
ncbi:ribonuclease Z [Anaerotalea alkaliphila]|uniref:Ribonuclease Z n=1 Tax=Anaerotalea alkaliphila TaxID=2662126 RepID=A0A7X5HWA2_9FIRM|nr:ribonuclease Z [Anaerotalea alkaliphila]NDL67631.1 ribonuclease Z [Anaerotalea alkaliphila]